MMSYHKKRVRKMKKIVTGLLTLGIVGGMAINTASAAVMGDDYPAHLKNASPDSKVDSWTMYNRECVSFVAWRLHAHNKFELPVGFGSAWQWGSQAKARGHRVDNIPSVGSVAWFAAGHVAWVAEVAGNNVVIEEYNYNYNHNYHRRTVDKSAVSGFIHFKDLTTTAGTTQTTPKSQAKNTAINVGSTVKFAGVFQVNVVNIAKNSVASDKLSGGRSTTLNLIDAVPLDETTASGTKSGNQVLAVGEYFKVNGTYRVLAIDRPSNGIKVKIGAYETWLDINQAMVL